MATDDPKTDNLPWASRLAELARLFLKIGSISFGGPAVFTAIMEEEVVRRRGWVSHEEFLDYIGTTNLIPGPNAVEMAAHIGFHRAGFVGALVAGISFALPAVAVTIVCAWAYVRYGTMPGAASFLAGIKPAVLAVLFAAVWRLGKKSMGTWQLALIGIGVGVASFYDLDEVFALLLGGVLGMLLLQWCGKGRSKTPPPDDTSRKTKRAGGLPALLPLATTGAAVGTAAATMSLWQVALFFLKVGAVLYGTGYVLAAYLEGGLVASGCLTKQELLDAVAIGQLTPGPITSAVAFVGYVIKGPSGPLGLPGAIVASVAVYTPGFIIIGIIHPMIPRLRRSPWASNFLDAVSAASIGLMAAVGLSLAGQAVTNWQSGLIAIVAGIASFHKRATPARLIIAGGIIGALLSLQPDLPPDSSEIDSTPQTTVAGKSTPG